MTGRQKIAAALALAAGMAMVMAASCSRKSHGDDQACLAKNSAILEELKRTLEEGSKCEEDSDCQVLSLMVCPLGCYAAVSKRSLEKVRAAVADTSSRLDRACLCEYKCAPAPKSASCTIGRCTSRDR
jgi:hypothetical protein